MTIAVEATRAAVGYLRRSTDRQEQSIEDQRKAVEKYAIQSGFEITEWYVDDAISGAGAERREAFLKMVADASERSFKAVIVYDVKRFGRLDNDETGYYRHLLAKAGVEVLYASENFSGDDTDDLLRPVKQWQARQELKDLSKVTIRGLLSKGEGGWWLGGTPPCGYDLSYYSRDGKFLMTVRFLPGNAKEVLNARGKVERKLAPGDNLLTSKEDRAKLVLGDPKRVKVVRDIFDWYVREELGHMSIADRLNRQGVPSPQRRPALAGWSMGTVREIVNNPTYTGDMVWNRRSFGKFHSVKRRTAVPTPKIRNVKEVNSKADWIVSRNSHPAIIPRRLYEEAQAKRCARRERHKGNYRRGRGATSPYLLTGLITCKHCGHHWQGYTQTKGKPRNDGTKVKTPYYGCGGYITKGTSICQRSTIHKDVIEGFIFEEIGKGLREFLDGEEGQARLRKVLVEMLGPRDDVSEDKREELLRSKADLETKIYNILDNITPSTREFADKRVNQLKGELMDIESSLMGLENETAHAVNLDALMAVMLEYMKDFDKVVAEGTVEEKRAFLRAFTNRVEIDPDGKVGYAELFTLPRIKASSPGCGNDALNSSFQMVAGAGFEPATSGL